MSTEAWVNKPSLFSTRFMSLSMVPGWVFSPVNDVFQERNFGQWASKSPLRTWRARRPGIGGYRSSGVGEGIMGEREKRRWLVLKASSTRGDHPKSSTMGLLKRTRRPSYMRQLPKTLREHRVTVKRKVTQHHSGRILTRHRKLVHQSPHIVPALHPSPLPIPQGDAMPCNFPGASL